MFNFKRFMSAILAVAVVLSMGAILGACGNRNGATDPTGGEGGPAGEKKTYTVTVRSAGGMVLPNVGVSVYADSTKTDMKDHRNTDADGKATFQLPESDSYAIELSGLPKGYQVQDSYSFTGGVALISVKSALVAGESLSGASLKLGDVMYDFTVTTTDGTQLTLSEAMEGKKMALLNFWFSTCGPCANEFPYLDEAYQMYQDDVAVIALNSYAADNDITVKQYKDSMGLSIPMAKCGNNWLSAFGTSNYPTSVVIDRYGVICLIEIGGMPSLRPFVSIFDTFTGDDYQQKLYSSVNELVTAVKPTHTMPSSEEIAAVINNGSFNVTYKPETGNGAEYSWPFIIADKNGQMCIKASNQKIESSYAILYAEVELKKGQAVGFDYLISSEKSADILHVIVNDEAINSISGWNENERWDTCYPCVAEEDGVYEIALCYIKDESNDAGDDTVYIKNMRVIDAGDIDAPTYLPRQAAVSVDGFEYSYADVVYNSYDGYYHVGSKNGPLLLANLMSYTQFSEEETVWEMAYNGKLVLDGHNYADEITKYCNYASNSLYGVCTVNQELYELLQIVDTLVGFDDADTKEWLKLCTYYQAYGTATQFQDPIKGLAPFSAYTAKLGSNNYFYYDRIIMPRGLLAKFVPTVSGVYRITSSNESVNGVDGWIFDGDMNQLLVYEADERMYQVEGEVSMLYYMEAGKAYYIDIAFWDPYEVGYIYYTVEYVASQYDLFRMCSPGPFTYDTDATGEAMYDIIAGGISVVQGNDGYYYEDLGKDAYGNQLYGSKIYADFYGLTSIFDTPITTNNGVMGLIQKGAFDFSKTEEDMQILAYMGLNENDPDKTRTYLKNMWGEDYDANAEIYQIEDVFKGIYHGKGEDLTADITAYLGQIITTGSQEKIGCVAVTKDLADILQKLMDKFTFENVENSWVKLCYYYDHLGPKG